MNADAIRENLVEEGYDPSKIVVIRNGITLSRFAKKERGAAIRQELGFPPAARLVGVFSRLNRMKGVQYFLDAAARSGREISGCVFPGGGRWSNQAGTGRAGPPPGAWAADCVYRDSEAMFRNLLSEAAISVLPSLSEGTSNTLLESMAAGIPVVATRVGGNPEVIEDGVSGLLVPPRDSAALAAATARLLEDEELAARLGQAGMRRVSRAVLHRRLGA